MYPDSAGIIDDCEDVCRGAFINNPDNYNKQGEIRANLITEGKLLNGQLSVYRVSDIAKFTVPEVADQLKRTHSPPKQIYSARASEIRGLRVDWLPDRLFCIVDNIVTDRAGSTHLAHAHILVCENVVAKLADGDIQGIRDVLFLLFKKSVVWNSPMPA